LRGGQRASFLKNDEVFHIQRLLIGGFASLVQESDKKGKGGGGRHVYSGLGLKTVTKLELPRIKETRGEKTLYKKKKEGKKEEKERGKGRDKTGHHGKAEALRGKSILRQDLQKPDRIPGEGKESRERRESGGQRG